MNVAWTPRDAQRAAYHRLPRRATPPIEIATPTAVHRVSPEVLTALRLWSASQWDLRETLADRARADTLPAEPREPQDTEIEVTETTRLRGDIEDLLVTAPLPSEFVAPVVLEVRARAARGRPRYRPLPRKSDARLYAEIVLATSAVVGASLPLLAWLFT